MKITALFVLSWVIFPSILYGQTTMEEKVRRLFSDPNEVTWMEHFKGRVSDMNDVALTLASDGDLCKGILWYLRSKAALRVEGVIENDTMLSLVEYDSLGTATGTLIGTIKDFDGIQANWYSMDKTIGEVLVLMPTSSEPRYPGYCGDNKWLHRYEGQLADQSVEMFLRRGNNGYVKGLMYWSEEEKSYPVEGRISKQGRLVELEIKTENWQPKGKLTGKIDFNDRIEATFQPAKGNIVVGNLDLKNQFSIGCIEYADFATKIEVTYPKTTVQTFNDVLEDKVQGWLTTARTYTTQLFVKKPTKGASQRAAARSYCWYEPEFISTDLMSFKLFMTHTWDEDYQAVAFNFSFTDERFLAEKDIFKPDSGYKKVVTAYIQQAMKKRPFVSDGYFESWVKTQPFELVTFRKEGICFSTSFNGIYGAQEVTIPFAVLKPYLQEAILTKLD